MSEVYRCTFIVPASHPSLPGHFPGAPVAPGVLILDRVLEAAQQWRGQALKARGLTQVKFHSPLLPGETADLALETRGSALEFRVTHGARPIAQGQFVLAETVDA